jgi:hypothetical protein
LGSFLREGNVRQSVRRFADLALSKPQQCGLASLVRKERVEAYLWASLKRPFPERQIFYGSPNFPSFPHPDPTMKLAVLAAVTGSAAAFAPSKLGGMLP